MSKEKPEKLSHSLAARVLGPDGPFVQKLDRFSVRDSQIDFSVAVESAIGEGALLVAEAGTGTGKTFAYLAPAIISGLNIVVSTGTKALQDQLFYKDLPLVRKAMGRPFKAALLKGRANYLCTYRLHQARASGRFKRMETVTDLERINAWAKKTKDGDITACKDLYEDSPSWQHAVSSSDNCLGTDCPDLDGCFVYRARRSAQKANIVVVNHHLLFADMAVKRSGFGEILPGAHVFILDEAHQVPDVASLFFSRSVTTRQLNDVAADIKMEAGELSGAFQQVKEPLEQLDDAISRLREAMETLEPKGAWNRLRENAKANGELSSLFAVVGELVLIVEPLSERSKGMETCFRRIQEAANALEFLLRKRNDAYVYWYEVFQRSVAFHATPLDVAEPLEEYRQQQEAAWIFTSATLAVGQDFGHFKKLLGLQEAKESIFGSPFDFWNSTLLYHPGPLPLPNDPAYVVSLIDAALPVLDANKGGSFLLFTSYRAMHEARERLAGNTERNLYVQGEMPKQELLDSFREDGEGILLGTSSFWEGVDVAGTALSLVLIDKLPFAAPNDPVLEARLQQIRDQGGNPFFDHQVPAAVIALKQGAGRLIRSIDDFGVLMLCDPRLTSKSYGKAFLNSLPKMPRTKQLETVQRFYKLKFGNSE